MTLRDDLEALATECQTEGEFPASSGAWRGAHLGFAKKLRAILAQPIDGVLPHQQRGRGSASKGVR